MKKLLYTTIMSFPIVCCPSESDVLMTFSTKGPDIYEDGSTVLDGEYYALVWQSSSINDVRFTMDGNTADTNNSIVLRILPRAKDGRCIPTTFSVNKDRFPRNGYLKMYMLDTRTYDNGIPSVGNEHTIQSSTQATSPQSITFKSTEGTCQNDFTSSLLPEYITNPFISSVSLSEGKFTMVVSNTFDNVNYVVVNPLDDSIYEKSNIVTGRTDEEIEFVVECGRKTALFGIRRK